MKITLANDQELTPILVTGGQRFVQGENRDTLSFIFPASAGLESLDTVFTAENCESITIEDDEGGAYVHKAYTVRAELQKTSVEVTPETADAAAVLEDRIIVVMAQRTFAETQLVENSAAIDDIILSMLEG